jgi:hypothetical protein
MIVQPIFQGKVPRTAASRNPIGPEDLAQQPDQNNRPMPHRIERRHGIADPVDPDDHAHALPDLRIPRRIHPGQLEPRKRKEYDPRTPQQVVTRRQPKRQPQPARNRRSADRRDDRAAGARPNRTALTSSAVVTLGFIINSLTGVRAPTFLAARIMENPIASNAPAHSSRCRFPRPRLQRRQAAIHPDHLPGHPPATLSQQPADHPRQCHRAGQSAPTDAATATLPTPSHWR